MRNNNLPAFIIIGAMKSATTSLHYYLDLHPEISMSKRKELNFFIDRNWEKGINWYKKQFNKNNLIKGEASPEYSKFPFYKNVPERMSKTLPDVKIIYLVREPIKRLISHLHHDLRKSRIETKNLDSILNNPSNKYLLTSKYFFQIEQYFPYFSKDQFLILTTEELNDSPAQTLEKVFKFIGVDSDFYTKEFTVKKHASGGRKIIANPFLHKFLKNKFYYNYLTKTGLFRTINVERPKLSENLIAKLRNELREDIFKLEKLMGRKLHEWNLK